MKSPPRPAEAWARSDLEALSKKGLFRELETVSAPASVELSIGAERLVSFSSNDYLGLAASPDVAQALSLGARESGSGAGASRLVVGDLPPHGELERALAELLGAEAGLIFGSGYAANLGAVGALAAHGDVVFSDAHNHASLIDGCRLSRAQVVVYPHGDVAALGALLLKHPGKRRWIVTDSVFSMDGDLAPLPELCDLADREGLGLYVDEAHAFGVLGKRGAGLAEALGLTARIDARMVTFGKALGGYGAAVVSSELLRAQLVNRARSFVFSTALAPPLVVSAQAALRLMTGSEELRQRLLSNAARFAAGLSALGFPARAQSAIFPVVLGPPDRAMDAAALLRKRGFLVKAIRPPTVPAGTSRLRFALSAAHTERQIDGVLAALGEVLRELP